MNNFGKVISFLMFCMITNFIFPCQVRKYESFAGDLILLEQKMDLPFKIVFNYICNSWSGSWHSKDAIIKAKLSAANAIIDIQKNVEKLNDKEVDEFALELENKVKRSGYYDTRFIPEYTIFLQEMNRVPYVNSNKDALKQKIVLLDQTLHPWSYKPQLELKVVDDYML